MTTNEYKSFFKEVKGGEGERCLYSTRLDTFGRGCQHNCKYCYAKSLLSFRGLWDENDPAVADEKKVRNKIRSLSRSGFDGVIRLGGMTDCFQPAERKNRITLAAIEELEDQQIEYLIVTKSDLVADIEYESRMSRQLAHIQVSITSTDKEISLKYERAPIPERRIAAVEKLYDSGFDVAIRLSPYIPEFLDLDIIERIRCDKVLVEFLRVNHWVKKWFEDVDFSMHTLKSGGYQHLILEDKIDSLTQLICSDKQLAICEDVPEHYDYFRKYLNHNKNDCCNLLRRADRGSLYENR